MLENNFDFDKENKIQQEAKEDLPRSVDEQGGEEFDFTKFINSSVLNWLGGGLEKPPDIKKLGEDFATKINWFVACAILGQYARLPKLFESLKTLEDKVLNKQDIEIEVDPEVMMSKYSAVQKQVMDIMEFARKFVVQNKDVLTDNVDFYDRHLYEKIKSMPTDLVRDVLTLLSMAEKRGHNWLRGLLEKYKD